MLASSLSINAPALVTLPVEHCCAPASIPFNLVWSASVKSFVVKPPSPTVYVVFVLSIVKLGYVPVTEVAPVPVKATVWSGELFVIVPLLAIEIPVPPVRTPVTLAVSVTSAFASIPSNLVWSASVNALVSALFSYAVFISASVWSAVALASIPVSLVFSASVKALVSASAS
jgi:hypothetical protein